jgi:hypothetical protein
MTFIANEVKQSKRGLCKFRNKNQEFSLPMTLGLTPANLE